MKFNSAIASIAGGLSLLALGGKDRFRNTGVIAAGGMALIGLLTLFEYAFRWGPGIDQLVVKDLSTKLGAAPGRMAITTAATRRPT